MSSQHAQGPAEKGEYQRQQGRDKGGGRGEGLGPSSTKILNEEGGSCTFPGSNRRKASVRSGDPLGAGKRKKGEKTKQQRKLHLVSRKKKKSGKEAVKGPSTLVGSEVSKKGKHRLGPVKRPNLDRQKKGGRGVWVRGLAPVAEEQKQWGSEDCAVPFIRGLHL